MLYSFAGQYQNPQTNTFRLENKKHFTLDLVQNRMKIGVWLRYTVCLSGSEGWQGNCKKLLEGSNICECYYSMKFKKKKSCFQIEISVSSVPIIFSAHVYDFITKIKIWYHVKISEKLLNLELSGSYIVI